MMIDNGSRHTSDIKIARIILTVIVLLVMLCIAFLLSSIETEGEDLTIAAPPTPVPTVASTPTSLPKLITVEYQINVISETPLTKVEFWYTSESGGVNQTDSIRINNTNPITETVMGTVYAGERVEIAGVITDGTIGALTCQILIGDMLVEHSLNQGAGASVYCSGIVPEQ